MIALGYTLLTLLMFTIILIGYGSALKKANVGKRGRKVTIVGIGMIAWMGYTYLLAKSGFLQDFSLPPRFPLLLVLPAFIFIAVVFYTHHKSTVLEAIPPSWLVYYQTFRIAIELLFLASVGAGLLHPEVTFEGYNYDLLFGISAPLIGFVVFNKRWFAQKVALCWNYLGLGVIAIIIFLFVSTTFFPSIWGSTTSLAPLALTHFPFILVASFLMPSAVFMHVASIIQLKKYN